MVKGLCYIPAGNVDLPSHRLAQIFLSDKLQLIFLLLCEGLLRCHFRYQKRLCRCIFKNDFSSLKFLPHLAVGVSIINWLIFFNTNFKLELLNTSC